MKRLSWQARLALVLVLLSALAYVLHFFVFRDVHHIFIYLVGDIAFVPIEVLLVTLIIHRLLSAREKRTLLHKLNMVIGAFFSEVGTRMLELFREFDPHPEQMSKNLVVASDWTKGQFARVRETLKNHDHGIYIRRGNLQALQSFLLDRRDFLLRLLENPNLLEHESFTELLWAVFHLMEELAYRVDVKQLPETDYEHLAGDMRRVYALLVTEWVDYMDHLRVAYPYLFSLAMRTNPFDPNASPEVAA